MKIGKKLLKTPLKLFKLPIKTKNTPYIDDEMALFAKELESRDKAAVFYTTGNIPENTDAQILHARKFSYTFNAGYAEVTQ